jgi:hypothetical protein
MVITEGRPLLPIDKVPSLVDESGRFFELHHNPEGIPTLDLDEVRAEWKTQIESFISCGFRPDHLDSHHHISYFNSKFFKVMLDLAREYQLPVRYPPQVFLERFKKENVDLWLQEYGVKAPSSCITSFYGHDNEVSSENLIEVIDSLGNDTYEVMCHPGYADQELLKNSSYSTPRELELEILTDPGLIQWFESSNIQRIRFSDL